MSSVHSLKTGGDTKRSNFMRKTVKGRTRLLGAVAFALAVLVLAACASQIPLTVQRTPSLDTSGIQRIAIMPFESSNSAYQNAARHATTVATERIRATNHFTLINPSTVTDARNRGEGIENYVDAMFGGQILRIAEGTDTRHGTRTNRETGETVTYTYYVREVEVEFNYSFTRARDGALIGPIVKKGSTRSQSEHMGSLDSVEALVNRAIDNQLRQLNRDVAPYTIRITRSLEKEPNKALKPEMDGAFAHVKAGNYVAARQAYHAIWSSYSSVAAAVNASIMLEAIGETMQAATFMQQVVNATGSPLATRTLSRIQREIAEQLGLAVFEDTRSPAEKAADFAVSELQKVLPRDARVAFQNSEVTDNAMVNNIIINMTSSFIRNNITVVERQEIDRIMAELDFQLSGSVSDDSYVSLGKLAGANCIIIVNVTGTGANRRLQVRALNIETGTVMMQSGTGSEWNL